MDTDKKKDPTRRTQRFIAPPTLLHTLLCLYLCSLWLQPISLCLYLSVISVLTHIRDLLHRLGCKGVCVAGVVGFVEVHQE